MKPAAEDWDRFIIRISEDKLAADALRVVFQPRERRRNGRSVVDAAVVLGADGQLILRYTAPAPDVAGFRRDDFIRKAYELIRDRE